MRRVVVTRVKEAPLCAIYEEDELKDIYFVEGTDVGTIYLGRIENVVHHINGCFVQVASGKVVFLRQMQGVMTLEGKPLHAGGRLVVQIDKERLGDKAAIATTHLELAAEAIILTRGKAGIGLSKKITSEHERKRLKKLGRRLLKDGYGLLFRTAAMEQEEEGLVQQCQALYQRFAELDLQVKHRNKPGRLLGREPRWFDAILDDDLIYTDDDALIETLIERGCTVKVLSSQELSKKFALEREVLDLLKRKVYLPHGGNVVFDSVEAMSVIDVNTAGAITGSRSKMDFYQVNLEAAKIISRQIRLRNLSGIILIDFINMKTEEERQSLIKELTRLCQSDGAYCKIYGFTKLGILEMTRKRVRVSLHQYLQEKR